MKKEQKQIERLQKNPCLWADVQACLNITRLTCTCPYMMQCALFNTLHDSHCIQELPRTQAKNVHECLKKEKI